MPSIGNWGFPCKSHYFITNNRVSWKRAFTPAQIAAVQRGDQRAVDTLIPTSATPKSLAEVVQEILAEMLATIKGWFGK